jgi:hypothetical protein
MAKFLITKSLDMQYKKSAFQPSRRESFGQEHKNPIDDAHLLTSSLVGLTN